MNISRIGVNVFTAFIALYTAIGAPAGHAEPIGIADYGNFYEIDAVPEGSPGDLIRVQEVTALAPNSRAWRVLYLSTSAQGEPVVVSGLVGVPILKEHRPELDIVSWAHGTKGINDRCAPSRGFRVSHNFFDIAPEIIKAGWIAVGTDYEGLGTPGVHPYLVANSEAYNQLDIVRAAKQIPGVTVSNRFVGWGRSQGGHATLALAEEAQAYASELELLGVIAAAPVGDMPYVFFGSAYTGASFNWLVAAGLSAAWDIDLSRYYEEEAVNELNALIQENTACYQEFGTAIDNRGDVGMRWSLMWRWRDLTEIHSVLQKSSVGDEPISVPVLVSQGSADKIVLQSMTDKLVAQMCELGTQVQYQLHPGESHNDSSFLHMDAFIAWTQSRFRGEEATGCQN